MKRSCSAALICLLFLAVGCSCTPISPFMPAISMGWARSGHAAVLLKDGSVLVAGGGSWSAGILASAEVYTVSQGFVATGSMSVGHYGEGFLLPDGRALIVDDQSRGSVFYDPDTGAFSDAAGSPPYNQFRRATMLMDGRILISGFGYTFIYDPVTQSTTDQGVEISRSMHTATLLTDGRVLLAGGHGTGTAEIYDPAANTVTPTGSLQTINDIPVTAVLLNNGQVLVGGPGCLELYDPATGVFTVAATGRLLDQPDSLTRLNNGDILVISWTGRAYLYEPGSDSLTEVGRLNTSRQGFSATLLPNGDVLIAGGNNTWQKTLASAELYHPATRSIKALGR